MLPRLRVRAATGVPGALSSTGLCVGGKAPLISCHVGGGVQLWLFGKAVLPTVRLLMKWIFIYQLLSSCFMGLAKIQAFGALRPIST